MAIFHPPVKLLFGEVLTMTIHIPFKVGDEFFFQWELILATVLHLSK